MTDLSALSLQTALTPVAMPSVAAPLENAGNPAELGAGSGTPTPPSFDALLALVTTTQAATPQAAGAILPEGGKTLPDAATAVAALPLANMPKPALPKANPASVAPTADAASDATADPLPELVDDSATFSDGEAQVVPQPDIALFAAIFSAPERLSAPVRQQTQTGASSPQLPVAAATTSVTSTTTAAPTTPAAVAVAIASTAQIELTPTTRAAAAPVLPQAPNTDAAEQASVAAPAVAPAIAIAAAPQAIRTAPAAPNAAQVTSNPPFTPTPSETAPHKPAISATEATKPQIAEALMPSTVFTEAPVQADIQPAVTAARSETKAERIDFATLVDTLARAREEASPRTVNVAVTNTDFGRVSLRFDSSDNGLAVAMSSADPGFARAVTASADAAATSADTRNPNPQAQADARAQASDPGAQRQQSQQQQTRPEARAEANSGNRGTQTSTLRDTAADKTGDSGIYA